MIPTDTDNWLKCFLGIEKFKPGLDRLRPLFNKFKEKFQQKAIKIVTIAGTNGKGETSLCVHHLLRNSGANVVTWTSPHVVSVTERYLFNDNFIANDDLFKIFESNKKLAQELSYYEFLFYCFCCYAYENSSDIDYIVLEVGLGGRLDAVNLFDSDVSAITSISRDHTEFLGSNLIKIFKEKLGVARKDKPLFINVEQRELQKYAQELYLSKVINLKLLNALIPDITNKDYSFQNRSLASLITQQLLNDSFLLAKIDCDLEKLSQLQSKGRMEKKTYHGIEIVFNGSHNIDGVRKCRDYCISKGEKFDVVIFGPSTREKSQLSSMLKVLKSAKCLYNKLSITTFSPHPRSCSRDELEDLDLDLSVVEWKKEITRMSKNTKLLILGSYYFIGEVQKFIDE